jgi:hypothetical protein
MYKSFFPPDVQILRQKHENYEKKGNITPQKVNNFKVTHFINSKVAEIMHKEIKRMIIRMINVLKRTQQTPD